MDLESRSIAIYLPDLSGGGAERLHLRLAPRMVERGWEVAFVLAQDGGQLAEHVPRSLQRTVLGSRGQLQGTLRLARYLSARRPAVLIANTEHNVLSAIAAKRIAQVPTKVLAIYHNTFSMQLRRSWKYRALLMPTRIMLPHADGIVAVSQGVANDLATTTGVDRRALHVIYNGVEAKPHRGGLRADAHPWLAQGPIVLAMGRLVAQKDFPTLVRAFARVAACTSARLIVLGEGPERSQIERLIAQLGMGERIALLGHQHDPAPFLEAASVFALTSLYEGFGNVLAEAMMHGVPVVSTDCPHGPGEILEWGKYGALVPIGDVDALGRSILSSLRNPLPAELIKQRGEYFGMARCVDEYVEYLEQVMSSTNVRHGTSGRYQ